MLVHNFVQKTLFYNKISVKIRIHKVTGYIYIKKRIINQFESLFHYDSNIFSPIRIIKTFTKLEIKIIKVEYLNHFHSMTFEYVPPRETLIKEWYV